jgi:prepilin-type N-terminal cleavage/methylation domain-containing protein
MRSKKGFTLIELMVVILIIGILAAVAVPLMRGRINRAKWSEANAGCGTIWTAVRAYIAEKGPLYTDYATDLEGPVTGTIGTNLGFNVSDLVGTYFVPGNYVISDVVAEPPACVITVTGGTGNSPPGEGVFTTGTTEPFVVTGM